MQLYILAVQNHKKNKKNQKIKRANKIKTAKHEFYIAQSIFMQINLNLIRHFDV
jgi:hypothetical protein